MKFKKPKLTNTGVFLLGCAYVIISIVIWKQFITQSVDYFTPLMAKTVVVEQVEKIVEVEPKDQVMAERIIKICKDNGLTADEDIKWVLGKLWNESRWQQYANHINQHKNGTVSLDRGLVMWNDYFHPEVSDECAYSVECAVSEMVKYRKDGKDIWHASDEL